MRKNDATIKELAARKNDAAIEELVAKKNDAAIKELVPLRDKTPTSKIKEEEEKGIFNSAWKSAGPDETEKGLKSTWTGNCLNGNERENAVLVGLNEKHMACERIETNKVMIRLQNDHVGHKNGDTGSGSLKPFRSESGVCVEVSKTNTRMSTYDIGMYRDKLDTLSM